MAATGLHGVPVAGAVQTRTLALGITCPLPPFETVPLTTWRTNDAPWPKHGNVNSRATSRLRNDRIAPAFVDDSVWDAFAESLIGKLAIGQLQPSTAATTEGVLLSALLTNSLPLSVATLGVVTKLGDTVATLGGSRMVLADSRLGESDPSGSHRGSIVQLFLDTKHYPVLDFRS